MSFAVLLGGIRMIVSVMSGHRPRAPLAARTARTRPWSGEKAGRERQSAQASQAAAGRRSSRSDDADSARWELWIQRLAVIVVGWFVAFQPIGADDWWWQLSRGRAVWEGSWAPSASLLTLEERPEADWLGGLPAYVLYESAGAAGWMLCRVVLVGLLLWLAVDSLRSRRLVTFPALLLTAAVLVALASQLDPVPQLFGMLGMLFVAWWCWPAFGASRLQNDAPQHRFGWHSLLGVGAVFWLWGSTAPSVAVGGLLMLIAALCATLAGRKSAWARWIEAAVAVVAGSLNPRGLATWSDSFQWLLPASVTSPVALEDTPWEPLHWTKWGFDAWTFIGLTVLWIANRWFLSWRRSALRRHEPAAAVANSPAAVTTARLDLPLWRRAALALAEVLPFLIVQAVAWSSLYNVSLAIVWLAGDVGFQWRAAGFWTTGPAAETGAEEVRGGFQRLRLALLARCSAGESRSVSPSLLTGLLAITLLILLLRFSGLPESIGWGISGSLDNRLLLAALEDTHPYGTALADDMRSGGMLQWIVPQLSESADSAGMPPLRLQDIPSRAITGGRWERHRQLLEDLERGRLMRYWRDDGTPGGYWLELDRRGTTLLCISNRNVDLIRGLEPSRWKPLSLDSPVIPFAPAGDEAYIERLIEVLQEREIVEYQNWQYQLPVSAGSAFDRDLFGFWPDTAEAEEVARQADVLRAMDLHYAALRVLFVGRQAYPDSSPLLAVLRECQAELAEQEYELAGRASWFRHWAARYDIESEELPPFVPPPQRGVVPSGEAEPPDPEDVAAIQALGQRIEEYWRVGPAALLAGDGYDDHPQIVYAMLCGAMEAGLYDRADQFIAVLRNQAMAPPLAALVQQRHRELHPPDDGS